MEEVFYGLHKYVHNNDALVVAGTIYSSTKDIIALFTHQCEHRDDNWSKP